MVSGLGRHQKDLLQAVLRGYREVEQHGHEYQRKYLAERGVYRPVESRTGSEAASHSRALKQLEERGLVRRHAPGGYARKGGAARTTWVQLTDAGRAAAERLSGCTPQPVPRPRTGPVGPAWPQLGGAAARPRGSDVPVDLAAVADLDD